MKSFLLIIFLMWYSPLANTTFAFNRQDSLRGSNGHGRSWWDIQHYTLSVMFDTTTRSVIGSTDIRAKVIAKPGDSLQLDLQGAMVLDSVVMHGKRLSFAREGNVWWVTYPFHLFSPGALFQITAYYHGKPQIAKRAPWDGGFIWTRDSLGNPWVAVACQGLGASSWWPCKDYQGDEPDEGMIIDLSYPQELSIVSNGRVDECGIDIETEDSLYYGCGWTVQNPINTYNTTFYVGDYVSWNDTLMGENGKLDLSFHVLRHNEQRARQHFAVTKPMLRCFEYWMGPFPFYQDGFKLVEAPYLGMEHQSAVAYGNKYQMGYLGMDRSGTGIGNLFDFIIIHESGHEWFGNNITARDIADNWLHEGFTTYTETLFAECAFGRDSAFRYTRGLWRNIENDRPVIGSYGVNDDGSGDKYAKGAAVVHMIRMIINDDQKFRQLLRNLNKDFRHRIVSSQEVEEYISKFAGYNFKPLFDQYLRSTQIPTLEWNVRKRELHFRFIDVANGFSLPIEISSGKTRQTIRPTTEWQTIRWTKGMNIQFSPDFLIKTR